MQPQSGDSPVNFATNRKLKVLASVAATAMALAGFAAPSPANATAKDVRLAYVADSGGDAVGVIDPTTNTSVANISVGDNPRNLAANPNRETIYVPNRDGNTVSVIDVATNTVTATIGSVDFDEPYAIAFNSGGTTAYVANKGNNIISIIDTATTAVTGSITDGGSCVDSPEGIAINPVKAEGYVASRQGDNVCVFSTSSNTVTQNLSGFSAPRYVTVTPDGSYAYVTNEGSGDVNKITTSDLSITPITLSGWPRNSVLSSDAKTLYVATMQGSIKAVDVATDAVSTIEFSGSGMSQSYAVAIVAGETTATDVGYVTDDSQDIVAVFDPNTNTEVTGTGLPITEIAPSTTFNDPKGIVAIGYDRTPPAPPAPVVQTAANNCVVVPKAAKIQRNGLSKVMKRNCVTNAGQSVSFRKQCRSSNGTRGDVRLCRVVRKGGATYIKTYGNPVRVTLTWSAPEITGYTAFNQTKKYKA